MNPPANPEQENADFELLQKLVREAGKIALGYFGKPIETKYKPDGTEVSEADLAVDHYLKTALLEARPGYGWLSEENDDDLSRLSAARVWVVDPIDGTRAFLQQKDQWVVSVALLENGQPVLGCVYNPVLDEFFSARAGHGAYLNNQVIKVGDTPEIANSRIVGPKNMYKSKMWADPWPHVEMFWANSIAYRICLVAANKADATVSMSGKSDWDVAAAQIILQEAGGVITAHNGERYIYNQSNPRQLSVLAASPEIYVKLLEKTKTVDPKWLRR